MQEVNHRHQNKFADSSYRETLRRRVSKCWGEFKASCSQTNSWSAESFWRTLRLLLHTFA